MVRFRHLGAASHRFSSPACAPSRHGRGRLRSRRRPGRLGFIGGVEVQKGQDDGGTTASPAALAAGGQGNATVGSVANKKGSTLYVKHSDGNLARVKTTGHSKINRTASTTASAIHPGDTVIVHGETSKSGTVTATQIQATAAGATSGLAGLFGGGSFGGGGGQGPSPQQAAPDGG
jgi:hypothetical protein